MLSFFKENFQFFTIILLWLIVGAIGGPLIFIILPATLFLLARKGMHEEILLGFLLILILSDNILIGSLVFAKSVKNIYIVLLFLLFIFRKNDFLPLNKYFQRYIPFYLIAFIAMFYSETLSVSIQKTTSYIILFIAVPNYVERLYREKGEIFFKNLIYFLVLFLFWGIAFKYIDPSIAVSHGGRLTGIFGNPNGLGIFCVLIFCLFYVVNQFFPDLFSRQDKLIVYFTLITSIVWCGSRNSLVAVGLFLFFAQFYRMSPFLGFIFFLLFVFSFEIITNNYVTIIRSLGLEEYFRIETLEKGGGRYIAWNFAWEKIQDNFFLGKGFAFDEYIMRKNFLILSKLGHEGGVHNTYLIIWLNTGLVGLILFLWAFIGGFIKAAKNTTLALPVMYTIMFTIMFEPWLISSLNPFTSIFLIIVTLMWSPSFKFLDESKETKETEIQERTVHAVT